MGPAVFSARRVFRPGLLFRLIGRRLAVPGSHEQRAIPAFLLK